MNPAKRDLWRGMLVAAPGLAALGFVLIAGTPPAPEATILFVLVLLLTWAVWYTLPQRARHLRTIGNLLDALREGDYGVRGAHQDHHDDFTDVVRSFNRLAARLQDEQRDLQQSLQLLSKTLAALDGAVFAFEHDQRLRLINPAGERLLGRPAQALLGHDAIELDLAKFFELPSGTINATSFSNGPGRWQITHAVLRSRSQSGRLLLIQPMERALREEEAQAFRRLLRVLSHEINNSMTPIASMADTLCRILPPIGAEYEAELDTDLRKSLAIINQRSTALQRFIGGYARLAKLPQPQMKVIDLAALCKRVEQLLSNPRIVVEPGVGLALHADADQLEQVLINLMRNALEAGGDQPVHLRWKQVDADVKIEIIDNGHGLPASENLFVPFFTTKADGAGIGLTLSRQIIEAMHGHLEIRQRDDAIGAVVMIKLPIATTDLDS